MITGRKRFSPVPPEKAIWLFVINYLRQNGSRTDKMKL
jgi:hypothetical protein